MCHGSKNRIDMTKYKAYVDAILTHKCVNRVFANNVFTVNSAFCATWALIETTVMKIAANMRYAMMTTQK